jgi:ATP-dependent RNA helicase SUPV3L1/SUV3
LAKYSPVKGSVRLSVSSVKQISGRAGRYGLHDGGDPGGTCTTLHESDLSYLRQCLAAPFAPLEFTRIGPTNSTVATAITVLPAKASLSTIIDAHSYIGRIPSFMRYAGRNNADIFEFVDNHWSDMNIGDRLTILFAPIPWRDRSTTEIIIRFLNMHSSSMTVDFMEGMKNTNYLEILMEVESDMDEKPPHSNIDTLSRLESFHKIIVFYVWMTFRSPVVYSEFEMVSDLKLRLEKVLNWSLEGLSKNQGMRVAAIHRPMDAAKFMSRWDARAKKEKGRQKPTMAFAPTQTQNVPVVIRR